MAFSLNTYVWMGISGGLVLGGILSVLAGENSKLNEYTKKAVGTIGIVATLTGMAGLAYMSLSPDILNPKDSKEAVELKKEITPLLITLCRDARQYNKINRKNQRVFIYKFTQTCFNISDSLLIEIKRFWEANKWEITKYSNMDDDERRRGIDKKKAKRLFRKIDHLVNMIK